MSSLPDGTRVGRVALDVADLDGAATFYEDAVGLATLADSEDRVTLGAGEDPLLELRAAPDAEPRPGDAAGLFHVAYRVPARGALGDALGRLRESGRMSGASDHIVSEALYARDPEGNGVEVYRDRPRDEWDRKADGRPRIDTLPLALDDLADDADGDRAAPPGTDVGHVHLEVTDLDDAHAFYVDALGFDRVERVAGALFVAAGGYHHHVGLNVWNRRSAPASGRGLAWFEVVVPGEAALAAAVDRVAAAGYAVTETDAGATVADPAGVEVRLVLAA
jgi:catechol 2,3-dioxygenase